MKILLGILVLLGIIFLLLFVLFDPDQPLLKTDLPNGYYFHSNGGIFGYIAKPNGNRMSEYFGIISNDKEEWCNGFNWYKDYVVCELEIVKNQKFDEYTYNYFIINTKSENIYIIENRVKAEKKWKELTNSKFPELKQRHRKTKEK